MGKRAIFFSLDKCIKYQKSSSNVLQTTTRHYDKTLMFCKHCSNEEIIKIDGVVLNQCTVAPCSRAKRYSNQTDFPFSERAPLLLFQHP
jgi:hypothetical protein